MLKSEVLFEWAHRKLDYKQTVRKPQFVECRMRFIPKFDLATQAVFLSRMCKYPQPAF
jgi:hypothetical protein